MVTLPTPPLIEDEDLPKYALAMNVLDHHQMQDVHFRLHYSDVGLDKKVVAKLVGLTIWTAAYPTDGPQEDHPYPTRVLGALRVALTRLAISQESRNDVTTEAVDDILSAAALRNVNY